VKTSILGILIALISCGELVAGEHGGIKGRVVEETSRRPVPGANVMLAGSLQGASTDSNGYYIIADVAEGLYEIRFSCLSYRTLHKPDIRVVKNKVTRVPDAGLTETTLESEGVTVTAGLFQDDKDVPVSSFNFTEEEIRRSPGAAGDILRALSTLPGVSTPGGEFSAFSVRGGGPKDNIILVDNIPFTKVSHFDEGGLEGESAQGGRFSIFAPSLVENAQFHAGGFPARYGGKHSSIINLNLRDGNVNAMTVFGHYDLFGWEATYDGPLLPGGTTGVLASARHVNFKTILDMIGELGHGIPAYTDVLFKSTTAVSPSHTVSLLGIYSDDTYSRDIENVFASSDINTNQLMQHRDYRSLGGLNWQFLLGRSGFLHTTAHYYANRMSSNEGRAYTAPDFGIARTKQNTVYRANIYDNTKEERTWGVKSDLTLQLGGSLTLFAGAEVKRTDYRYDMALSGNDTLFVYDAGDRRPDPAEQFIALTPEDFNEHNGFRNDCISAYAELLLKPSSCFTVTPGLRFDRYTHTGIEYYSPRLSARYQLTPTLALNGATGIYYQLPELHLLAMDRANTTLGNERAVLAIAGVSSYLSEELKFTAECYFKSLSNVLVRSHRNDMKFTNGGTGRASGVDLGLVKRFSGKFYGQASYSYTVSRRDDHDGMGEYDYEFSRPHIFNILGGYQFNEEWSMAAKWYVSSGLPADDCVIHSNVLNDPNRLRYSQEITRRNGRRFPANHSLNIRVDYRTQFRYFALGVYVDILNVYGAGNISSEEFLPQSGKQHAEPLGVVPTFGFRLEL
jgi:hypothetical protein